MDAAPFAAGAMRECYRMKKLTQQPGRVLARIDWKHSSNYVAKRYKSEVARDIYFEDVKLQMVRGWGCRLRAGSPHLPPRGHRTRACGGSCTTGRG